MEAFVSASPKRESLAGIPESRYLPNNRLRVWGIRSFKWCLGGTHIGVTDEIVRSLRVSLARTRLCFWVCVQSGFVLWSVLVPRSDGKKKFALRAVSSTSSVVENFRVGSNKLRNDLRRKTVEVVRLVENRQCAPIQRKICVWPFGNEVQRALDT